MLGPHYPRPGGVSTQVEALTNCLRSDGVTVHSVDTNIRFLRKFGKVGRLLIPPAQLLIVPLRLWRVVGGADIIHAQLGSHWGFYLPMIVATLVGWLRCRPIVASWHGGRAPVFVPANQGSVMFFLKRIDALIVSSAFTGRLFESLGLHPIAIPNVIELEHYQPNPPGNGGERLAHPEKPALLWIKNMDDAGDPSMMVRAFARLHQALPGATLTMIGDGYLRQEAQSLAQELGTPIAFPGRVSFSALRESYARADIFVIASAFDNQPCTLIEASACGLPVVATATGGIPDMVQDGVDAILAPPGNPEALADAVLRVAQDPELASKLGHAAIENAQKYRWPEIRARLSELYLHVVDRDNHG
jgi:phenylacetate-CoA ligase